MTKLYGYRQRSKYPNRPKLPQKNERSLKEIFTQIPLTTLFILTLLMYKTKPNIYSKKSFFNINDQLVNKFWWISTSIILLMHLTDITYYDGRISILFWVLIAGIRCHLREINVNKLSLK